MPKKPLDTLTEPMFYVLMALAEGPLCGIDIAEFIRQRSQGQVNIGPATLYTILAKFEKETYIKEIMVEGRKRTYQITDRGLTAYQQEITRLQRCLNDAHMKGGISND